MIFCESGEPLANLREVTHRGPIMIDGHILHVCRGDHDRPGCMFCDGGLSLCVVCGAFEGAWPDECPRAEMTDEQADRVYRGGLNFRDGRWRPECCDVMLPYDVRLAREREAGRT